MPVTTKNQFLEPSTTIRDVDLAFPARGNDPELLPAMNLIPEEFKRNRASDEDAHKWVEFQSKWFSEGLPSTLQLYPSEGINPQHAFNHLRVLQGCYGSRHEHKSASVAWLASLWFDGYDYNGEDNGSTQS